MSDGLTPFEVTAVEGDFLQILPRGSQHARRIQRRDVELARRLQLTGTALSTGELIQGGVGKTYVAYIVGILHALTTPHRLPDSVRK